MSHTWGAQTRSSTLQDVDLVVVPCRALRRSVEGSAEDQDFGAGHDALDHHDLVAAFELDGHAGREACAWANGYELAPGTSGLTCLSQT